MDDVIEGVQLESFYIGLECLKQEIDGYNPVQDLVGNEAFRIFTSLTDFTGRIISNLVGTLGRLSASFKRGEMEVYLGNYQSSMTQLFSLKTFNLDSIEVQIPDGLVVDYQTVVPGLILLADKADIAMVIQMTAAYLELYAKRDPSTYTSLTTETTAVATQIGKLDRVSVEKDLRKYFVNHHGKNLVSAKKVFGSISNVEVIVQGVVAYSTYYRTIAKLYPAIKTIEGSIDVLIKHIDKTNIRDQNYLRAMHSFVFNLAVQLDMAGVIIHEMQRVEHNVVLGVEALRKAYKIAV
jgi:hypothetical protein